MERKEKEEDTFGIKDKIGYMFGDFGNDFTFLFASIFLMVFYTKVLGISAGIVGTLFLIVRCMDAFTDITMGRIVDRSKPSKEGRFRPWILRMCGPVAITSFFMYQVGMKNTSIGVKIVYMFVTYILWGSICYTAINIPYGSMASVLSPDADDRASLSTFRSVGAVLAQLVAGGVSIAATVCYLLCYFLTTERVKIETKSMQDSTSFSQTIKSILSNRPLLGMILAALLLLVAQIVVQSINQYLFIDYFKNKKALSIMTLSGVLPSFILAPFAVPVSRKFGKKEIGIVGSICSALSYFLLFFIHTKSVILYIGINMLGFLGMVGFNSAKAIQSQEVLDGIYNIATLLPGILYLGVALCLLFFYPLNKKQVEENISILKQKREQENIG